MTKFYPGQKVVCTNAAETASLSHGDVYTVDHTTKDGFVMIKEFRAYYYCMTRFVPADPYDAIDALPVRAY